MKEVEVHRIGPPESYSRIWCVAWNASGSILASCGDDKVVRVWKKSDEAPVLECRTSLSGSHTRAIRCVAFSHDGRYLASAAFDSTVILYEKGEDGEFEETNKLEGHQSEVKCVTFAPSDEFLASCSRDKSVWFWQIDEEEDLQVSSILQPHTGDVKSLRWHPSEDILVSCSYDSSIRFYKYDGDDWVTTQLIEDAHKGTVWSCSFDGDGKRLVTVGEDKTLQLWERIAPEKWSRAAKYAVESRWPLYTVDWNAVNGLIAVGGGDGIVRIFRVEEGALVEVETYEGHEVDVNCVAWHPKDSQLLATASDDGSIRLLRVEL